MMKTNDRCRICGGSNLIPFLDLGDQPLANDFLKKEELSQNQPTFPLRIYFCSGCNLVQLIDVVDKNLLFKNYIYFSSGMPKLSDHFKNYALEVMDRFLKKGDFVVEIASNDGILLKFFKDLGYKVLGVDPAVNVVKIAESLGITSINDFFSEKLAGDILTVQGPAKAILANNVVAHINDHQDLAKGIYKLLDDDGVFILEAPYLMDMFENLTYDTIYHEHLSYLAVRPLKTLFQKFDLEIFDVEIHPVQGQSLRVFVDKIGRRPISENVQKYIELELKREFNFESSYRHLAERVEKSKANLVNLLKNLKKTGKRIGAYGAPAKGNTVLNYCNIGTEILHFALEDLSSKQGLYTPGRHIPVISRAEAEVEPPDYYLLLAWNYMNHILAKEKNYRANGGKFIVPVGDAIKVI